MITPDFIVLLGFGIVLEAFAIVLFTYGIYFAITDRDAGFCVVMIVCSLFLSFLSGLVFYGAFKEYNDAKPQNQVKILEQKIFDAEKEYQKYLIDHPELKESE
jgi:phosphotransferase system  glucose/maltose/N-acetylglucosamine-specific IIC component